jgi:hypothetical protein
MRGRSHLPEEERSARSRLTQLLHNEPFLKASLYQMARTCGYPNCRCITQGKKHVSWYASLSYKGKRRLIYIPADKVESMRRAIDNYQSIRKYLACVSEYCFDRLRSAPKEEINRTRHASASATLLR